jgi:hypothetical protein
VFVGFCHEAAQDHSPGLQPWGSWLQSGALKVDLTPRSPGTIRRRRNTPILQYSNTPLVRRFVLVLVLESGHAEWGGVMECWSTAPIGNCTPRPRGWECFQGDQLLAFPRAEAWLKPWAMVLSRFAAKSDRLAKSGFLPHRIRVTISPHLPKHLSRFCQKRLHNRIQVVAAACQLDIG